MKFAERGAAQRLRKREGRAQLSIFSGLKLKGPASSSSVCGRS